jgi:hypothetical protein
MIYFQGNTPLKVSIILNIGATEVSPLLCTYLCIIFSIQPPITMTAMQITNIVNVY